MMTDLQSLTNCLDELNATGHTVTIINAMIECWRVMDILSEMSEQNTTDELVAMLRKEGVDLETLPEIVLEWKLRATLTTLKYAEYSQGDVNKAIELWTLKTESLHPNS